MKEHTFSKEFARKVLTAGMLLDTVKMLYEHYANEPEPDKAFLETIKHVIEAAEGTEGKKP